MISRSIVALLVDLSFNPGMDALHHFRDGVDVGESDFYILVTDYYGKWVQLPQLVFGIVQK